MATPRSNSVCTLGSHDVGKLTLPSISSCWLRTLVLSTIVIRLAPIIRYFGFMAFSHRKRACARRCGPLRIGKKDVVHEGVKCLPTASSAAHTLGTGLRHLPLLSAARRKYTPVIRERGRVGKGSKAASQ